MCNRIIFKTCSNITMRNQNSVDKVVLVSLLLTWNMLRHGSTVSTSEAEQANVARKDTDPITSLIL